MKRFLPGSMMVLCFGSLLAGAMAHAQAVQIQLGVVSADLVTPLDTKKAKVGDAVSLTTRRTALLENGAELSKGTELVGKVSAVTPSAKGVDGSVTLVIDTVKLKGGAGEFAVTSVVRGVAPQPPATVEGDISLEAGLHMGDGSAVGGANEEKADVDKDRSEKNKTTLVKSTMALGSTIKGVDLVTPTDGANSATLSSKGKNVKVDAGAVFLLFVKAK